MFYPVSVVACLHSSLFKLLANLANCSAATDIAGVAIIIKTTCQGELNVLEEKTHLINYLF